MKQKELIKTFMVISYWKKPLVPLVYTKTFYCCEGQNIVIYIASAQRYRYQLHQYFILCLR